MTAEHKLEYLNPVLDILDKEYYTNPFTADQLKSYIVYQFQIREGLTGANWNTVIRYIPECDVPMDIRFVTDGIYVLNNIISNVLINSLNQ